MLDTVWLHCDEAQLVGCLRGLESCPLVKDTGISHNSQGVVDGGVDKAGYEHCGTREEHSTLRLNAPGLGWLFAEILPQNPNWSQQAASGARRVTSASCEVTQGVGST